MLYEDAIGEEDLQFEGHFPNNLKSCLSKEVKPILKNPSRPSAKVKKSVVIDSSFDKMDEEDNVTFGWQEKEERDEEVLPTSHCKEIGSSLTSGLGSMTHDHVTDLGDHSGAVGIKMADSGFHDFAVVPTDPQTPSPDQLSISTEHSHATSSADLEGECQLLKDLLEAKEELIGALETEIVQSKEACAELHKKLVTFESTDSVTSVLHELGDQKEMVQLLQNKCNELEDYVKDMESKKSEAAVKEKMATLDRLLEQQCSLQDTLQKQQKDIEKYKRAISHLEEKVELLQSQKSPKPSRPPNRDSISGVYFPGRWTALRAESKKYKEEMRIICDALEKEGFGPSQVSADEAIRHLWWQKENHRTSPGQPTEKEAVDFSKIFQEYQEKIDLSEEQVTKVQEELRLTRRTTSERENLLKKQLEASLKDYEEVFKKVAVLDKRRYTLEQDNSNLRRKMDTLRSEILTHSETINKLRGGLSSIEREKIFVESQLKMCEHRHATSKLEWETFKHQMEQSVKLLDAEKSSLQEQLQVSQNTVTRLQEAKTDSEQKIELQKQQLVALKEELTFEHCSAKNAQLKLSQQKDEFENISSEFGDRLRTLELDNEDLKHQSHSSRQQVEALREELDSKLVQLSECQTDLDNTKELLHTVEKKLKDVDFDLKREQTRREDLEGELREAKTRAGMMEDGLKLEVTEKDSSIHELQIELVTCKKECSQLTHQLEVQRERTATSLNKLHQQYMAKCNALTEEKSTLEDEIERTKAMLVLKERNLETAFKEKLSLQNDLRQTQGESDSAQEVLHKERVTAKLMENKLNQIQSALEKETSKSENLEREISVLKQSHSKLQLELATERERVYGITEVKSKLESELDSERRAVQELSSNLKDVDNRLRLLDQEASEKLKTQQKQNRKLKKELTKQMTSCDELRNLVGQLERVNGQLNEEKLDLLQQLELNQDKMDSLKTTISSLEIRNQECDVQLTQLKLQINTMQQAQVELEEQNQHLNSSAKAEMQRMLSEVTHHMEQQYTAHRNLEKLRTENEKLALRQKDRKIETLKSELRHTRPKAHSRY